MLQGRRPRLWQAAFFTNTEEGGAHPTPLSPLVACMQVTSSIYTLRLELYTPSHADRSRLLAEIVLTGAVIAMLAFQIVAAARALHAAPPGGGPALPLAWPRSGVGPSDCPPACLPGLFTAPRPFHPCRHPAPVASSSPIATPLAPFHMVSLRPCRFIFLLMPHPHPHPPPACCLPALKWQAVNATLSWLALISNSLMLLTCFIWWDFKRRHAGSFAMQLRYPVYDWDSMQVGGGGV